MTHNRVNFCEKCAEGIDIIPDYAGTIGPCALCFTTTRTSVNVYKLIKEYADGLEKYQQQKQEDK